MLVARRPHGIRDLRLEGMALLNTVGLSGGTVDPVPEMARRDVHDYSSLWNLAVVQKHENVGQTRRRSAGDDGSTTKTKEGVRLQKQNQ